MAWKQAILARNGGGNYLINKTTKSYYIITSSTINSLIANPVAVLLK